MNRTKNIIEYYLKNNNKKEKNTEANLGKNITQLLAFSSSLTTLINQFQ